MEVIYQGEKQGCLYSCIKMLMTYYFDDEHYADLKEPFLEERCPNLLEGMDYAKRNGLLLEARRLEKKEEICTNTDFPLILLYEKEKGSHAVVLKGRKGRKYLLLDPDLGKRKVTEKELLDGFSRVFLIKTGLERVRVNLPNEKKDPFKFILDLSPLFYFLSFLIAYYAFSKGRGLPLGLIFLCLGAGIYLLDKLLLLHCYSNFDSFYFNSLNQIPNAHRRSAYTHFTTYKGLYFSFNGLIYLYAGEVCFFYLVFSIEELSFAYGFAFLFLVSAGLYQLRNHFSSKIEMKMSELENNYFGGEEFEEKQIGKLTKDLMGEESLFRFLRLLLEIACGAFCYFTQEKYDLNGFFFYLLPYFYFGEEFLKIISYPSQRKSFKKEESYFQSHFLS